MTKLQNGIGYAKPDSLALVIPITEIIHNGSALTRSTCEVLQDEIINTTPYKASQKFEIEGVPFIVRVEIPPKNEAQQQDNVKHFVFPVFAKMLGKNDYDGGITINNFQRLTGLIEEATNIKFKPNSWAQARFRDLDNAVDKIATAEEWSNDLKGLWERVPPELRRTHGRIFTQKNGLISAIQFNNRKKEGNRAVTYRYPFCKFYDKQIELIESRRTGSTWGEGYEPGMRKRFESQIRTTYWSKSSILNKIERPKTFEALLTAYRDQNAIMTDYARGVPYEGYITLPKPKIQRDMSKEEPRDFILNEWMQINIDQQNIPADLRLTPDQIKNLIKIRAVQAFGHKTGKATKIAKLIEQRWQMLMPEKDPSQEELRF